MKRYDTFITYYAISSSGKPSIGNYMLTTDAPLDTFKGIEKAMDFIKEELEVESVTFLNLLPCER